MRKLHRRPSPAMIVACLALFFALTGTSVAVVNALPKNSVGTAQLKKNAVISSKVKDGSLLAADFASGQLPKGAKGDTGAPGISGLEIVQGTMVSGSGDHSATVACPAGKKALGGGYSTGGAPADLSITTATVLTDGVTYRVDGATSLGGSWNLGPVVYCATVQS